MDLEPVDECEVLVLVDNVSDLLSTVPRSVTGEISNLLRAGATELDGRCLCCAQWGLSLVITVRAGDLTRTLLFDSGPEGHGVERNGERLHVPFADIGAVVFSHGHWDHVGGMKTALRLITVANGGRPVPVHVNDGMFVVRFQSLAAAASSRWARCQARTGSPLPLARWSATAHNGLCWMACST